MHSENPDRVSQTADRGDCAGECPYRSSILQTVQREIDTVLAARDTAEAEIWLRCFGTSPANRNLRTERVLRLAATRAALEIVAGHDPQTPNPKPNTRGCSETTYEDG